LEEFYIYDRKSEGPKEVPNDTSYHYKTEAEKPRIPGKLLKVPGEEETHEAGNIAASTVTSGATALMENQGGQNNVNDLGFDPPSNEIKVDCYPPRSASLSESETVRSKSQSLLES
jgi:hypothetical protein